jgi:2'-5' RNA ligase
MGVGELMKATFALLANRRIYNLVRKLAWQVHQKYHTGIEVTRLPPHVSLKQPFDITDMSLLEEYMVELAGSISPFDVRLRELQIIPAKIEELDSGILWIDVEETEYLRALHNRLNHELGSLLGDAPAPFDGDAYHFHMTVAIGGQPFEVYQKILADFAGRVKNLSTRVDELALFSYDDEATLDKGYLTYMVLPLGKQKTD